MRHPPGTALLRNRQRLLRSVCLSTLFHSRQIGHPAIARGSEAAGATFKTKSAPPCCLCVSALLTSAGPLMKLFTVPVCSLRRASLLLSQTEFQISTRKKGGPWSFKRFRSSIVTLNLKDGLIRIWSPLHPPPSLSLMHLMVRHSLYQNIFLHLIQDTGGYYCPSLPYSLLCYKAKLEY